eukprot:CAMPEP_0172724842 /NCGR_PEP_ID=MMETSP1074-20121228/86967_1 /TAXON_ID=2916 /ORGANISM="Ceratium fusus, Strain PA161109" /LENGTH=546 /DNA_ID=CAMNT_0013551437 /DNA_START=99 /DNA_END=1739 /DNA_ORIENTATION=+
MDVEEPSNQQFIDRSSRFFPMDIFKCCPLGVKALMPGTISRIQDATHLILVIGVIACSLLVISTAFSLFNAKCFKENLCLAEFLSIIFIVPCTIYCFRIIGQYDERLNIKQLQAKEQKDNLTKTYNSLLTDMDGLLSKSAESSAGLAERSFESKRRDFQRFLERVKSKYSTLYSGTKGDSDKLLKEFRRFCINWLKVFEECSIDPIQCPKRVITSEELNRCTSISEVADMCLDRLRVTEVRFISIQRDQDQQMLRRERKEFTRLTLALPSASNNMRSFPASFPTSTLRQQEMTKRRVSWIGMGGGQGWGISSTGGDYPTNIGCGCANLTVLSREHGLLLTGFCVGWIILVLQIISLLRTDQKQTFSVLVTITEVLIAQTCLFTMLLKFEEIDIVQKLEREVKALALQNQQVEKQREKMREFWTNAQQLTELWLYRTVPRLDLYKEVHCLLEDADDDLLFKLSNVNQQLEDLESKLCALQAWRCDGTLTIEDKKTFGKVVNELCHEQEIDGILLKLEDISSAGMRCLGPPPTSINGAAMESQFESFR